MRTYGDLTNQEIEDAINDPQFEEKMASAEKRMNAARDAMRLRLEEILKDSQ